MEQVIFKIDGKLKAKAMKKAKRDGTTYSHVLKEATQAYIEDDFSIGMVYSKKFIRDIEKARKEKSVSGDLDDLIKKY